MNNINKLRSITKKFSDDKDSLEKELKDINFIIKVSEYEESAQKNIHHYLKKKKEIEDKLSKLK